MKGKMKTTFKLFLLLDYEREEEYLTNMHKNGWKLIGTSGFIYKFEKCEPENIVYRLDFADKKENDMHSYTAMFAEYGWEYIQDVNDFSYFRKNADGLSEADTELFSDNESRLEMMKRIVNMKLFPVWVIFLCIVVPNFIKTVTGNFDAYPLHTVLTVIFAVIFVFYTYVVIHCAILFRRLKKKYAKE